MQTPLRGVPRTRGCIRWEQSAQLYEMKTTVGLPGAAERWLLFCQCERVRMSIIWQLGREKA